MGLGKVLQSLAVSAPLFGLTFEAGKATRRLHDMAGTESPAIVARSANTRSALSEVLEDPFLETLLSVEGILAASAAASGFRRREEEES